MQTGFTGLTRSSGTTENANTAPPSYISHSVQESDANSILTFRSNAMPTTRLLSIYYEQKSVLTVFPERFEVRNNTWSFPFPSSVRQLPSRAVCILFPYGCVTHISHPQDIENTVREMFSIPETSPIFVSADIPLLDNQRMLLHRAAWPVISEYVSVVWISDSADSSSVTSTSAGTSTTNYSSPPGYSSTPSTSASHSTTSRYSSRPSAPVISGNAKQVMMRICGRGYILSSKQGFGVRVRDGSTIRDLKQVISLSRAQYTASRIVIRSYRPGSVFRNGSADKILGDDERVNATTYCLEYR